MQLWLRHLANTTNLLPNASVQLIDNSYDVTISSALVNTLALLDMRVIGLIGAGSSAATKQTSILSNSRFVPQCDGASSSPDLSVKDDYPRFFRTLPNDNLQALAIYDFVVSMGWRRLAIISDSEPYGAGLLRAFEDIAYRSSDVQVVLLQSFASETIGNSSGWIPMFQKIRDVNAFIILIFAVQERVPTLLETAKKEGMLDGDKYAWIGSDAMLRPQSLVAPGLITVFPTNGTGYASAVYQSIWKERSGDINTTSKALSLYAPYFAGCLELFVRGFDRYLATTPNTNMADLAAGKYNERFPSPAVMFNFPEVYAPMGRISLDPETGDPSSSYDIFNVQTVGGTAKFVRVGTWLAMARSILIDSPIYYGSEASTTKPADDINLADYTTIIPMNSALGQTAIILNLLAMVLIAFAIAFFVAKGDETLLRKSA
ncbi:periplasmic binding protein-like I [Entophlyctis helioformis]|nr:periplasmic binding protein-like I [Entophlyctis helioformis]